MGSNHFFSIHTSCRSLAISAGKTFLASIATHAVGLKDAQVSGSFSNSRSAFITVMTDHLDFVVVNPLNSAPATDQLFAVRLLSDSIHKRPISFPEIMSAVNLCILNPQRKPCSAKAVFAVEIVSSAGIVNVATIDLIDAFHALIIPNRIPVLQSLSIKFSAFPLS